jgi:hypothetical protein
MWLAHRAVRSPFRSTAQIASCLRLAEEIPTNGNADLLSKLTR